MNVNKAKHILEQAGYVVENPQINEDFYDVAADVFDKFTTVTTVVFAPFMHILSVLMDDFYITHGFEDEVIETLERVEYAVIKKIMNNKLFKNIFRKVIKDENLKEKIKNKLIDIVKKRYGYIDRYDKIAEITNNFYDAMLEKLKETI